MKTAIQLVSEALKTSLSAQVQVKGVGQDHVTIRIRSHTDSGTPVYKDYRLSLEVPL